MLSDQVAAAAPPRADRRYLRIAQELLEAITRGDHPLGARLPTDREIALRCGVSRATVREALLALELIGVVEASVGAGVYVASSTPRLTGQGGSTLLAAPADLIETRMHLEPVVASLCAARISARGLAELDALVGQAEVAARDPEPFPRFSDLSLEFHAALARHCGNLVLGDIVRQLVEVNEHPLWVLLNQSVLRTRDERLAQVEHHRAIVRALAERDPGGASQAMVAHLRELASLIVGPGGGGGTADRP